MIKFNTTKVNGDKVNVILNTVSYIDLVKSDLETLQAIDLADLMSEAQINFGATEQDVLDALNGDGSVRGRKGLITSLNQTLQGANHDFHPNPNLVKHESLQNTQIDTTNNSVYVSGLVVSETILEENTTKTPKKEVKSGIVVQLKSFIEYHYNLKSCKFRTYKVASLNDLEQC